MLAFSGASPHMTRKATTTGTQRMARQNVSIYVLLSAKRAMNYRSNFDAIGSFSIPAPPMTADSSIVSTLVPGRLRWIDKYLSVQALYQQRRAQGGCNQHVGLILKRAQENPAEVINPPRITLLGRYTRTADSAGHESTRGDCHSGKKA